MAPKPKLAVFKFASCDGCQLTLLDCEDELLDVAGRVDVANFPEASRAVVKGPYDISLVEGSITTPHDAERIREVRKASRLLITIGACATAGGIQALRNGRDIRELVAAVYATPEYVTTLDTSTPIAQHVRVDMELRGCPISKAQLVEALSALLAGRRPNLATGSVCAECKAPGDRVRGRRPRHALPRARDPGRLRCHLPRLSPGLLRLLRAHGVTEHRVPRPPMEVAGSRRARPRPRLPDVQRLRPRLPGRERSP